MRIFLSALLTLITVTVVLGQGKIDSTIHAVKSAIIDGKKYTAIFKDVPHGQAIFIINNSDHKTLIFNERSLYLAYEGLDDLKFIDLDHDGYKDLLISYTSNVPAIQDLLLYDKDDKTFVMVKDFPDFPSSVHIPGTKLFYSYHRSGCADSDWDSDLFTIKNFKIIKLGNISGRDCDEDENGIFIYSVHKKKKKLVKRLTIHAIEKYRDTKWGFIGEYWKHHYSSFIHA